MMRNHPLFLIFCLSAVTVESQRSRNDKKCQICSSYSFDTLTSPSWARSFEPRGRSHDFVRQRRDAIDKSFEERVTKHGELEGLLAGVEQQDKPSRKIDLSSPFEAYPSFFEEDYLSIPSGVEASTPTFIKDKISTVPSENTESILSEDKVEVPSIIEVSTNSNESEASSLSFEDISSESISSENISSEVKPGAIPNKSNVSSDSFQAPAPAISTEDIGWPIFFSEEESPSFVVDSKTSAKIRRDLADIFSEEIIDDDSNISRSTNLAGNETVALIPVRVYEKTESSSRSVLQNIVLRIWRIIDEAQSSRNNNSRSFIYAILEEALDEIWKRFIHETLPRMISEAINSSQEPEVDQAGEDPPRELKTNENFHEKKEKEKQEGSEARYSVAEGENSNQNNPKPEELPRHLQENIISFLKSRDQQEFPPSDSYDSYVMTDGLQADNFGPYRLDLTGRSRFASFDSQQSPGRVGDADPSQNFGYVPLDESYYRGYGQDSQKRKRDVGDARYDSVPILVSYSSFGNPRNFKNSRTRSEDFLVDGHSGETREQENESSERFARSENSQKIDRGRNDDSEEKINYNPETIRDGVDGFEHEKSGPEGSNESQISEEKWTTNVEKLEKVPEESGIMKESKSSIVEDSKELFKGFTEKSEELAETELKESTVVNVRPQRVTNIFMEKLIEASHSV